jgi:hypothetical protein
MTFTATDLSNVQTALIALATGQRVVSLSIGDKTITYGQAQINELRALRDEIRSEVETVNQRRFVLAQTDKGL